jgi:hypothetical protein
METDGSCVDLLFWFSSPEEEEFNCMFGYFEFILAIELLKLNGRQENWKVGNCSGLLKYLHEQPFLSFTFLS